MRAFEINIASQTGGRTEQQDAAEKWLGKETCLLVVADGVGGSTGGRAASQTVIDEAATHWEQCGGIFKNPEEDLTRIAHKANDAIHALTPDEKRNPASTFVALYLNQTDAHWVHCGDSRLYWLRPENDTTFAEKARTRDHSVAQLLLEQNKITADEVNTHPDKGRLLKALGSREFKGVDYNSNAYNLGDVFLLCSDGYWESLQQGAPTLPPKPTGITSDEFAQKLVDDAVNNNGKETSDNTTLVTLSVTTASNLSTQPSRNDVTKSNSRTAWIVIVSLLILAVILILLFSRF